MALTDAENLILRLESNPGWLAGNVLDVRARKKFAAGHLRRAANIPLEDGSSHWVDKANIESKLPSIHLPPRHEPLLVISTNQENADCLAGHLMGRQRVSVSGLGVPDISWNELPSDWLERGQASNRLWKPPHWLADHLDLLPPPAAGPVLDLACGSGRAMVWLAELGYRVTGIDWQPEALELGRRLAADRQVDCRFLAGDLRETRTVPVGPWAVILNFRFRQVELLEKMNSWLQPGGVALIRTFRTAPGYEGHPSMRHRLCSGELLRYFPAGSCEILAHEESHDPDGRPASGIVARKK
jgi:tellurite methyltransferase